MVQQMPAYSPEKQLSSGLRPIMFSLPDGLHLADAYRTSVC